MDAFRKSVTALVALGIIGACGASASAGEARSRVARAPAGLGDATKAANSVNQLGSAAPSDQQTLVVDRPFFFFIRDIPTGAVLFAGQVTHP